MSGKKVTRMTLFKIPEEGGQRLLLEKYKEMPSKATKVKQPKEAFMTGLGSDLSS